MRLSSFVERIGGEGAEAWEIHSRAVERVRRGDDVIVLSIGDPDFDTPADIVEACIDSLRAGNTHYTGVVGEPALRQAIAAGHRRMTGQRTTADNVVVFSGAQNALFATALCLLDKGDEVIAPEPMYVTYEAVIGASGARIVTTPLRRETGFHLDLDALAAAVTGQTRAILLNTPHNPTGAVLRVEELEAVAEICRRHDLWLISDEVYATLTFERTHVSPSSLPFMAERTIVVSSLSKSHAMTGWRIGWTISPEALVPHFANLTTCMLYGCPGFIQEAAVTALTSEQKELPAMHAELRARRDLVCGRLDQLAGLQCLWPEATMFVMLDIRGTGLSSQEFADGLLDDHDVAVLPADAFGPGAKGFVRVSLSCSQEILARACEKIAGYVASLST